MKFSDYRTTASVLDRDLKKQMKSSGMTEDQMLYEMMQREYGRRNEDGWSPLRSRQLHAERIWYATERAYFNVWPCIMEMCERLPDDTPIVPFLIPSVMQYGDCETHNESDDYMGSRLENLKILSHKIPTQIVPARFVQTLLLRFPDKPDSEDHFRTIMLSLTPFHVSVESTDVSVKCLGIEATSTLFRDGVEINRSDKFATHKEGTLGKVANMYHVDDCRHRDLIDDGESDFDRWQSEFDSVVRVIACLGLLADPTLDLLQRDVIARDRGKPTTKTILNRATRNKGKGWDLGRELDAVPHTRRPHWGIRWMRENHEVAGNLVPRLRPIKGSVVKPDLAQKVPTGFLGKED